MHTDSSFDACIIVSFQDKASIIKHFYKNDELAADALKKFRAAKGLEKRKGPILLSGILKLVKRFEETGRLEDRPQSGRSSLKEEFVADVQSLMEDMEQDHPREAAVLVKFWECPNHRFDVFVSVQIAVTTSDHASRNPCWELFAK